MKTKIEQNEVVLLYKKGISTNDIIKKTGVSKATIWRIIKKSNIEVRPAFAPKKIKEDTENSVVELYKDSSNTIKDIMKRTGIRSEQTIYKILHKKNIKLRNK